MIRQFGVRNYKKDDKLMLDLFHPEEYGIAITNITGIGAPKATIHNRELASMDGGLFSSARAESRNIVISFKYLWSPTIEDARQLIYGFFPVKRQVRLYFVTDNRKLRIDGYVESNEPEIFSNSEGAEVSIICPFPYFYEYGAGETQTTEFFNTDSGFEFPFENTSVTEKKLEFAKITSFHDKIITYRGESEIGVNITINIYGTVKNIKLYNVNTNEMFKIDGSFKQGDVIEICTVMRKKSIKLTRNGVVSNIINYVDKKSDWFQLQIGENRFAYEAASGENNMRMVWTNNVLYEGV